MQPDPNFFILGAPKCGTTSLHHYLEQHARVLLSSPKEPLFFEAEYGRGVDHYRRTYFSAWDGETHVGDANPRHLFLPYVPERIHRFAPEARLIVCLRNPAARAYSHWWMTTSVGRETLPFREAIETDLRRIESGPGLDGPDGERRWVDHLRRFQSENTVGDFRTYVDQGYYAAQIRRYLALFPRRRLRVLLFEQLREDPEKVARDLWSFLGLDPGSFPVDTTPQLEAMGARSARLHALGRRLGAHRFFPRPIWTLVRRRLTRMGDRAPRMDEATRRWLLDHYEPHLRDLEGLLDRDLSHWRR